MPTAPHEALEAELAALGPAAFTARDHREGPVAHLVLFRYRDDVDAAERGEVVRRFLALADTPRDGAPYIRSIVGGDPTGGERAEHGFDHGFVVAFGSAGDRNFYVGEPLVTDPAHLDPAHAAFKEFVGPLLDDVLVFDIGS
jgi:hypothetical protein